MPDWVRPLDIQFDHVAAADALDAIDPMRFTLEWGWSAEADTAGAALAGWEGLAADSFRASHRARRSTTGEASTRLALVASAIAAAVGDAVAAQARVDALQDEWDAQLRREREAAALATDALAPAGSPSDAGRGGVPAGLR